MSVILLRTISSIQDKRIVLSNSQFARPIPFGTTWTTIRFGVRITMTDPGANLVGTPRLFLGLSAGTTNLFGDATTDHCVGVWTAGATWTRNAGPPIYLATGINSGEVVKRVGTTNTTAGLGVVWNQLVVTAEPANGYRSLFFVTITKGSPNFTISAFLRTAIAGSKDASLAEFLTQMEVSAAALTDHGTGGNVNIAVNEGTDGSLNAVHAYWNRTTPEIEISDIAVARFA